MLKSSVRTDEIFVMKIEEWTQVIIKVIMMERGMRGNSHVPCGVGEKSEIISKVYLSL